MPNLQLFKNNASSTLNGSLSQGGTTMILSAGTGSKFPAPTGGDYFLLTLYEKDVSANEEMYEIVKVTARTADTLTIVRDFENVVGVAGGRAYPTVGGRTVYCELRWTAAGATNLFQKDGTPSLTDKATPVDADLVPLADSAASFSLKKLTWANLKSTLKTWIEATPFSALATTSLNATGSTNLGDNGAVDVHSINGATSLAANSASTALTITQSGAGAALTIGGTAGKITGDFSNATLANRVLFQTSTTNGLSSIGAIPSGTGTSSWLQLWNNSDPTNASAFYATVGATTVTLYSAISGSGTYLPMTFHTGGSEAMRIDTSGNVGIGATSPSAGGFELRKALASEPHVVVSSTAGANNVKLGWDAGGVAQIAVTTNHALRFLTNNVERLRIDTAGNLSVGGSNNANTAHSFLSGNAANYSVFGFGRASIDGYIGAATSGAFITGANAGEMIYRGTAHVFGNNSGTLNFKIDTSGNVTAHNPAGVLGYGTGAGGTVTQATSKSTAVTLNKPTGQITMNNAALGAGATVEFIVNNSLVAATDVVIANCTTGFSNYTVATQRVATAGFALRVTNFSAGPLSEAVVISFVVIKGAAS